MTHEKTYFFSVYFVLFRAVNRAVCLRCGIRYRAWAKMEAHLINLINTSLSSSVFPTARKIAEVVPIPKTDDYELANNNRPISLLPVLSKVCERVVHKQVDSYLIFKDRLASTQSGNKRHHSTETSIIHSNDFILNAMDNKKLTASVFLDMQSV